jgi:nucleoid-associated protein EbfC
MGSKGKGGRMRMPMGGGGGGGMPNMNQLQKLQTDMANAQAALADETVTATVGGGAISVTMTGSQEVRAVKIDPKAVDPEDVEMLQDLLVAAFNQAREMAAKLAEQRMGAITGGLNIPGLF